MFRKISILTRHRAPGILGVSFLSQAGARIFYYLHEAAVRIKYTQNEMKNICFRALIISEIILTRSSVATSKNYSFSMFF